MCVCVCACASYERLCSVPQSSYLAWGDRSSGSSCLVCPQSLRLVNVYCKITISYISSRCRRATQKIVWIESFITNTWSNLLLRVELAACRGRLILLHSAASCAAATGASSVVPPAILLQPRAAGDTRLPPLGWAGWGGVGWGGRPGNCFPCMAGLHACAALSRRQSQLYAARG